ncbi:MAG: glycosyl hydrolase family 5, partial [Roseomonas sp.]|nr:glycosyl hydrolase family 5 [Roseomonas sp.]
MPSPRLRRRTLLLTLVAPALAVPAAGGANAAMRALEAAEWQAFCTRFLEPDGRVVDGGNGGISHSEGQGWGLLCAERAHDRDAFDRMWGWTRRTLARRGDALSSWRWRPEGAGGLVDDPNNATDGDLMIAWALLRAAQRWPDGDYGGQGVAIARDILRLLVRQVGEETVLLPGAAGFEQRDHVVLNPSYYAFPAMRALAQAVPDPIWLRLAADGLSMLRRARFGRWGLPPDWV